MTRLCALLMCALTGSLLSGALLAGPAVAVEARPDWGSVSASDGVLKRGCRDYTYAYAVTAPEDGDWDLNVSLVGPGGRTLWFGYLYEGANPDQGTATFRLCRSKTRPGRYRLESIVSVQDGNELVEGSLLAARFRLDRAR